ncbi:hypothetical protein GE21DRAFT_1275031 [Neurospora crassa]|nr:hypothetical protein GE21DRAFT_1275031 [Neurospora crassa]
MSSMELPKTTRKERNRRWYLSYNSNRTTREKTDCIRFNFSAPHVDWHMFLLHHLDTNIDTQRHNVSRKNDADLNNNKKQQHCKGRNKRVLLFFGHAWMKTVNIPSGNANYADLQIPRSAELHLIGLVGVDRVEGEESGVLSGTTWNLPPPTARGFREQPQRCGSEAAGASRVLLRSARRKAHRNVAQANPGQSVVRKPKGSTPPVPIPPEAQSDAEGFFVVICTLLFSDFVTSKTKRS